jgi:uncharacterized cupredoxin-like copper-binding protein
MAVLAAVGAALAGVVAHAGAGASRVVVTEKEYGLTLSPARLAAGKVTFVALDKGKLAHSLEISGPGVKNQRIPGTIRPGGSRSLTVVLRAGTYTLWCPVPGHAALGMRMTLKVGSGAGARPTSSAATTTKKGWG